MRLARPFRPGLVSSLDAKGIYRTPTPGVAGTVRTLAVLGHVWTRCIRRPRRLGLRL